MSKPDPSTFSIRPDCSIRETIRCIDRSARISIALLVDEQGRLLNTITDGDVRRGVLAGISLDAPVKELLTIKARTPHPTVLTAPAITDSATLLKMMEEQGLRQIPLIDSDGRVVDIAVLRDLLPQVTLPMQAVIMAGGNGTRLLPLTENCPKPMLPVGGRPLLELTIEKLQRAGIHQVSLSTNYQSEKISEHFGDGKAYGVELSYINEDRPLGTAGSLGLMKRPEGTFLVVNGDVLTEVDFEDLLDYHREHHAELTVGVRQYGLKVPYGVVDCEGSNVRGLREKPEIAFLVNAGIYLLEPVVYDYIPSGEKLDMTDLIQRLLDARRPVVSFPIMEYWLDVGQHTDYEQAQRDAATRGLKQSEAPASM
jgi:dTDP-glucose pyrophosphorylase/CBS domain-containing protein